MQCKPCKINEGITRAKMKNNKSYARKKNSIRFLVINISQPSKISLKGHSMASRRLTEKGLVKILFCWQNLHTLDSWIIVLARNMFFDNFQRNTLLLQSYTIILFWAEAAKKFIEFYFSVNCSQKNIFKTNKIVFWLPFCIKNTEVYSVPKYVLRTFTNCPLYREVEKPDSMY